MMCCILAVVLSYTAHLPAQQLGGSLSRRYVSILEQAGRGEYEGALDRLYSFVGEVPWYVPAYGRIAAFSFYSNQTARADSFFHRQISIHPANAFYGLGRLSKYRHQYRQAADFFCESIRCSPRSNSACVHFAECYKYDRSLPIDRAFRLFDTLAQKDRTNPAPLLGSCVLHTGDVQNDFGLVYATQALARDTSAYTIYVYCKAKAYSVAYNYRVYPRDYGDIHALLKRTIPSIPPADDELFGSAHNLLGLICQLRADVANYGAEYLRAYEIARNYGDKDQMAVGLGSLAKYDFDLQNYQRAIKHLTDGMQIAHEVGAQVVESSCCRDAGFAQYRIGNLREAISMFKKAANLQSNLRNRVAHDLYNEISSICLELQDYSRALDYNNCALQTLDSTRYVDGFPRLMIQRGDIFLAGHQPDSALRAFQAGLEVSRPLLSQDHETGLLMLGLARTYTALGLETKALQAFRSAGRILEKFTDSKTPYTLALADFHSGYGRTEKAIAIYRGLLRYHSKEDWEVHIDELVTLYEKLGSLFVGTGRIDSALASYASGIAEIEHIRTTVSNEFQAAQLLSRHINLYTESARLLAEGGKTERAFQLSEQARARTMRDRITTATMKFSPSIPDSLRIGLLVDERQLEEAQTRLFNATRAGAKEDDLRALRDSIENIEIHRQSINDAMAKSDGQNMDGHYTPMSLTDIRKKLGPADAVISYIWSNEGCAAFVITTTELAYVPITINRDRLIHLIGAISPYLHSGTDQTSMFRSSYNLVDAAELSSIIFAPLMRHLEGKNNLIIVTDDLLHYLPFEALPSPESALSIPTEFENVKFLLNRFTIHYLPSVGSLGWNFSQRAHAEERLLAVGNPSFGQYPPLRKANPEMASARGTRQELTDSTIVSLPFTGNEVSEIGSMITGSRILTEYEATADAFKKEAPRYQILHLATHFFIDDGQPFFSRLAFAASNRDERASYFQTFEVYQMRLSADLTVLSACNTALGLLQRGEGLNGIAQAFMTAGSPSLVVSLWSVDDRSTSILMKYLYAELLSGKTKSAALRSAKMSLIRDGYGDPFYWAGFVLIGNDDPLVLLPLSFPTWLQMAFILSAILVITYYTLHRRRLTKGKRYA